MNRTKIWRMHQLKRILNKRMKIIKSWQSFDNESHPWEAEPHRAHKFNLNCGCKMCHYYKHIGNSKKKFTHKDRILYEIFTQEKKHISNCSFTE